MTAVREELILYIWIYLRVKKVCEFPIIDILHVEMFENVFKSPPYQGHLVHNLPVKCLSV